MRYNIDTHRSLSPVYRFVQWQRLAFLLTLFALVLPLRAETKRLLFTPQWSPQSQFAGYYVAREKGYYAESELKVEFLHPSESNSAINLFKEGKTDVITASFSQALQMKCEGHDIVNIMQTSQQTALVIVSREAVTGLASLYGKKIGHWANGHDELVQAAITDHGLVVEWVPFLTGVNLFLSGAVDATVTMSYNEYYRILETGYRIDSLHEVRMKRIGYDLPEDGVYVYRSFYETHKDELQKFVGASRRGWLYARVNRKESCDIVMEIAKKTKTSTSRYLQEKMLDEICRLQVSAGEKYPTFVLRKESFDEAIRLYTRNGFLDIRFSYDDFVLIP